MSACRHRYGVRRYMRRSVFSIIEGGAPTNHTSPAEVLARPTNGARMTCINSGPWCQEVERAMDAFSEVLIGIKLKGALFFSGDLTAPWAYAAPPSKEMTSTLAAGRTLPRHLSPRDTRYRARCASRGCALML